MVWWAGGNGEKGDCLIGSECWWFCRSDQKEAEIKTTGGFSLPEHLLNHGKDKATGKEADTRVLPQSAICMEGTFAQVSVGTGLECLTQEF